MRFFEHFKTVTYHKWLVLKGCFAVGLYVQGLTHDLSKYSPSEFLVGVKYYQGNRSPNNAEREAIGYSSAWLHHKGRNKHHYEYWMDYSMDGAASVLIPVPMPRKYVVEMFMDRIAACKIYKKNIYSDASALDYYQRSKGKNIMHSSTATELEMLLVMLAQKGEKETFAFIKNEFLR